jgi:hypothetical protein
VVTPKPVVTPQPTPTVPTQPASTPTQPQVTAPSVSISGSSGSQNVSDGSPKQTLGTFTISLSSEPITVQTMAFTITPSNENDGISGYPSLVIVNPNGNTISTSNSTSNTFSSNDTLTFTNVALSMSGTYKIVGAGSGGIGDTFVLSTNPATNWSGAIGKTSGLTASLPNTVINLGTATFVGGGFILIAQIPTNYSQTVAASNDIAFTNLQLVPGWNGNLGSDGYIQLASVPLDLTANNGGTASNLSSCQLLNGTTPLNTGSNIVNPSSGQNIFTLDQPLRTTGTVTLTLTCDVGTNTTNGSSFAWSINPNDSWAPTNNKYAVSLQVEPSFTSSQPTTITSGGLNNSVVIVTNGYNNNLFVNASPVKIAAIQFNQATQTPVQLRGMQYQVISSDGVVPTLQLEYPDTNVQGTSVNSVIAGTRGNNIIGTNFSGSQTQMYLYASAPTAGSFVIQITGIQLADPSSGTNIPITGIPLTTGTITVQ